MATSNLVLWCTIELFESSENLIFSFVSFSNYWLAYLKKITCKNVHLTLSIKIYYVVYNVNFTQSDFRFNSKVFAPPTSGTFTCWGKSSSPAAFHLRFNWIVSWNKLIYIRETICRKINRKAIVVSYSAHFDETTKTIFFLFASITPIVSEYKKKGKTLRMKSVYLFGERWFFL